MFFFLSLDRKLLDLIWSKVWNLEVTERLLTQKLHRKGW